MFLGDLFSYVLVHIVLFTICIQIQSMLVQFSLDAVELLSLLLWTS